MSLNLKRRNRSLVTPSTSEMNAEENPPNAKKSRSIERVSRSELRLSQSQEAAHFRCGRVLQIHLTNFMCHANLTIKFHPRVNFLVGGNGSGKSAILAALVLGLGAKARNTNRSTNTKHFIKTGAASAKIEITLSNEGPQAYESEEYGDRITVVRSINQYGGNYAIKNASGRIMTRKVDELHRILMYHNVQVDNPAFVLNQDDARALLKELDPSKNYKLFLKATQIEMISEKLTECLTLHNDQVHRWKFMKVQLDQNQDELQELQTKLSELLSLVDIQDSVQKFELERLWLLVSRLEEDLKVVQQDVQQLATMKAEMEKAVAGKDDWSTQLTQTISTAERHIKENNTKFQKENIRYMEQETEVKHLAERCDKINSYMDSCKRRIANIEAQVSDLRNNIEERSQTDVAHITAMRQTNDSALATHRQRYNDNAAIMETARQDLQIYRNNKQQLDEQEQQLRLQLNEQNVMLRRRDAQIANIRASSSDKLSIYGQQTTPFLLAIEKVYKAGHFSVKPIGPLGRYIEVPNAQYRDVVEQQVKKLLAAYIVFNSKDRITLIALQQKHFPNYKPDIITSEFHDKVYDVSNGCVQPPMRGMRMLMSEIKCSNPVVMNCLIDHAKIEAILLADSHELAEQVTAHSQNVPPNLLKVMVASAGAEYYPDPHYRMYSLNVRPARFIQRNAQDRIRQLELEKETTMQQVRALEADLENLQPQLSNELQRINLQKTALQRSEARKAMLEQKIAELESYEYPEHNEVEILKNDLKEQEAQLQLSIQQLQEKREELATVRAEQDLLANEVKAQQVVMNAIHAEINANQVARDKTKNELRSLGDTYEQNLRKLTEMNKHLNEVQNREAAVQSEIVEASTTAAQHGERVHSERSEEDLKAEIQKLKARMKHRRIINEDPTQLREQIAVKESVIETTRGNYENITLSLKKLKSSMQKRLAFLTDLKHHMGMLLWYSFDHCCKLRNYAGRIDLNHSEKTLTISVKPRDKQDDAVSSTQSLSGGERSYATVAFLISLWSCVDHPFYFLDEYDVFTDEVNREFMTRLLINEGKTRADRQYVFLTPQALAVEPEDFIQIHKLCEPDRR